MTALAAAAYNEARLAKIAATRRRLIYRRFFTTSQVVTLPAGHYDIIAIGAGGSGGKCTDTYARATGGGGPAWARDYGKFDAPTPVTITIGAPGAGAVFGVGVANGNDGGTTSVTGIDNPITLTGGKAGSASNSSIASVLGGAGGIASGGKIRANGGRGGNITSPVGDSALIVTGGGAMDIFCLGGNATRGGDVTAPTGGVHATGGGGLGGRGGDSISASNSVISAGGGAGGNALDVPANLGTSGPAINGVSGDGIEPSVAEVIDVVSAFPGLSPIGSGTITSAKIPPPGGGSYSSSGTSQEFIPLGGSGAGISNVANGTSRSVTYGGGSGGQGTVASVSQLSGRGGAAVIIVSIYEDAE